MSHPLCGIGDAVLEVVGFNPQDLDHRSEAIWAMGEVFGAEPLYQPTGMGERTLTIRALCHPHVADGLGQYEALRRHHERQDVVPYIRLGAGLAGEVGGMVFVRHLGRLEERLAPDGRGRIHTFDIELVKSGPSAAGGF